MKHFIRNCHHQKEVVHWHDPIVLVCLYFVQLFPLINCSFVDRFHWQSNQTINEHYLKIFKNENTFAIERIFSKSRLPPPSLFI